MRPIKPTTPYALPEADARSIVSLLGQVAASKRGLASKKRLLMNGLGALIQADCWVWTLLPPMTQGEKPLPAGFMHGGFSEARLTAYLEVLEHPDMAELNAPFLEEVYARGRHTTRLRQQIDPDNIFLSLPVYPLWLRADIAPVLLSCHPFPDRCLSFIALYRKASASLFTRREARIAHILLSEVPWLHSQSWPQAKRCNGRMLSPRQRATLTLLLEGLGRKQIAAHLGITENTVSGYVRDIYRFYKIHSHPELIAYFREGDGGDL